MPSLKVTVSVDHHDDSNIKEQGYRAGCWVGFAHASLPSDIQLHFQHLNVAIWSHTHGLATITVHLVAWFPYKRSKLKHNPLEEFIREVKLEPALEMFETDGKKTTTVAWLRAELIKLLQAHLSELETEIARAVDDVQRQLKNVAQAQKT